MASDQDGPPRAKKPRISFSESIEVLVGPEQQSFILHKHIVCSRSPFFEAACSQRWTTAPRKPIELLEDEPEIFNVVIDCIYNDRIEIDDIGTARAKEDEERSAEIELQSAKSYLLADKLGALKKLRADTTSQSGQINLLDIGGRCSMLFVIIQELLANSQLVP